MGTKTAPKNLEVFQGKVFTCELRGESGQGGVENISMIESVLKEVLNFA